MNLHCLYPALPSHVVLLGNEGQHLILHGVISTKLELCKIMHEKVELSEH